MPLFMCALALPNAPGHQPTTPITYRRPVPSHSRSCVSCTAPLPLKPVVGRQHGGMPILRKVTADTTTIYFAFPFFSGSDIRGNT